MPVVKSLGDVSNFEEYPDSGTNGAIDIKPNLDPFLTWWLHESAILYHLNIKKTIKLFIDHKIIIWLLGDLNFTRDGVYLRDIGFNANFSAWEDIYGHFFINNYTTLLSLNPI